MEGSLFVFERRDAPQYGFFIMNRLNIENVMELVTPNMRIKISDPYLLYKNPLGMGRMPRTKVASICTHAANTPGRFCASTGEIVGVWFHNEAERKRIAAFLTEYVTFSVNSHVPYRLSIRFLAGSFLVLPAPSRFSLPDCHLSMTRMYVCMHVYAQCAVPCSRLPCLPLSVPLTCQSHLTPMYALCPCTIPVFVPFPPPPFLVLASNYPKLVRACSSLPHPTYTPRTVWPRETHQRTRRPRARPRRHTSLTCCPCSRRPLLPLPLLTTPNSISIPRHNPFLRITSLSHISIAHPFPWVAPPRSRTCVDYCLKRIFIPCHSTGMRL